MGYLSGCIYEARRWDIYLPETTVVYEISVWQKLQESQMVNQSGRVGLGPSSLVILSLLVILYG